MLKMIVIPQADFDPNIHKLPRADGELKAGQPLIAVGYVKSPYGFWVRAADALRDQGIIGITAEDVVNGGDVKVLVRGLMGEGDKSPNMMMVVIEQPDPYTPRKEIERLLHEWQPMITAGQPIGANYPEDRLREMAAWLTQLLDETRPPSRGVVCVEIWDRGLLSRVSIAFLASSNLKSADYVFPTRTLIMEFLTGANYAYNDVPDEIALGFKYADSAGLYFNRHIKGKYNEHKLAK